MTRQSLLIKTLIFCAVVGLYFAIGYIGLKFATIDHHVSPIWPVTGLAIGAILLFGRWLIPAIFIGALLVNYTLPTPPLGLFGIATGNTLEAIVGAYLIGRILRRGAFKGYTELVGVLFGTMAAAIVSATIGVFTLHGVGVLNSPHLLYAWYTWWSGDAIGGLLVLPLMVELSRLIQSKQRPVSLLGLFFLPCLLVTFGFIANRVFVGGWNQAGVWILAPGLILVALYLRHLCARVILLSTSFYIVVLIAQGFGSFEYGSQNLNLIYIQVLLACYSLSTLFARPMAPHATSNRRFLLAISLGWSVIGVLIYFISARELNNIRRDLKSSVAVALDLLASDADIYDHLLQMADGFLQMEPQITPAGWARFVQLSQVPSNYPAIHGLGFIGVTDRSHQASYVKRLQAFGYKDFKIQTLDPDYAQKFRSVYPITYIEPIEINRPAVGLDIGSEPHRREAAELAEQVDGTVATRPIQLVQDHVVRPGFLILNPVWKNGAGKGRELFGWTYAPVVTETFFARSLGRFDDMLRIRARVDQTIIFNMGFAPNEACPNNPFLLKRQLVLYHLPYEFYFYPGPSFFSRHTSLAVPIAGMMSIMMLLLSALFLEILSFGWQAEKLVSERTRELELSKMSLIQSSKMASLGEMAGGVAHEINNPLAIIVGRLDVLERQLKGPDVKSDVLIRDIHKIRDTADRIGKIVKGLRTFSRSGEGDPFQVQDVEALIADSLSLCNERFRYSGIAVHVTNPHHIQVECRASQISQVLVNLLSNAYDAIEAKPEKWIRIEVLLPSPSQVLISVTDSGHGIPAEVADKLMQPFFTTKDVGQGTGLGLSISRGIIEDHGGRLYLDRSCPNTRFVIELPVKLTAT